MAFAARTVGFWFLIVGFSIFFNALYRRVVRAKRTRPMDPGGLVPMLRPSKPSCLAFLTAPMNFWSWVLGLTLAPFWHQLL
jgi:hypothetical protein